MINKTQLKYLKKEIYYNILNKKLTKNHIIIMQGPITDDLKKNSIRVSSHILSKYSLYLSGPGEKYIYIKTNVLPNFYKYLKQNILYDNKRYNLIKDFNIKNIFKFLNFIIFLVKIVFRKNNERTQTI